MSVINHIIFDLDHTLWDFNRNSRETLEVLFLEHNIENKINIPYKQFLTQYYKVTNSLWHLYNKKVISKEELRLTRLPLVFAKYKYQNEKLFQKMEKQYLATCPKKPHLIPGALELLTHLTSHKHTLHLLTNGFKDIQHQKLKASEINQYFTHIVTSECSGYSKPEPKAFLHLLEKIDCQPNECIMIGDNLDTDITGSNKIGMQNIYFNPEKINHKANPTYEVYTLEEIITLKF